MYKIFNCYSLPSGMDPDEFWKYHTEVHAPDFMKVAGSRLKKYSINRIRAVRFGKPNFWGFTEVSFDSEDVERAVLADALKTILPNGKNLQEDFYSHVDPSTVAVVVEEREMR